MLERRVIDWIASKNINQSKTIESEETSAREKGENRVTVR